MGACQATPMQPRPYSSPGVPALLPARRASPSGGRAVRDKGVTYYSVDLGRVQRGGRDNDADRDVTVIPVIPGRRAHQGRCGGAGHHRPGPARAAKGSGPGRVAPGVATLGHQFQLRMARSFPLSDRVVEQGHQFQLRTAVPLSVAGVSRGVRRHQFQLRTAVPSGSQGLFGRGRRHGFPPCRRSPSHGFARRSPGPVAHRVPPSRAARR